jgi:hypothetical protein
MYVCIYIYIYIVCERTLTPGVGLGEVNFELLFYMTFRFFC